MLGSADKSQYPCSRRTFAIVTTEANLSVAEIHDRVPLIIAPGRLRPLAQ